MTDATDARLAAQYESYPYPARDPSDEARRLVVGSPSHLREIDHWAVRRHPPPLPPAACAGGGGWHRGRCDHAGAADGVRRASGPGHLPGPLEGGCGRGAGAGRGPEARYRLAGGLAAGPAGVGAGAIRLHRLLRRAAPSAGPGGGAGRPAVRAGARRRVGPDGLRPARPHRCLRVAGRAAPAGRGGGAPGRPAGHGAPGDAALAGVGLAAAQHAVRRPPDGRGCRGSTTCCSTRGTGRSA